MTESDHQAKFLYLMSLHVIWCNHNGYKVTSGDFYRDPRSHGKYGEGSGCAGYSSSSSLHKKRRAGDLNLFIGADAHPDDAATGGSYAQDSEAYRPAAEHWESLHPCCRSGIRYKDANHFEYVPGYDNRKKPL